MKIKLFLLNLMQDHSAKLLAVKNKYIIPHLYYLDFYTSIANGMVLKKNF